MRACALFVIDPRVHCSLGYQVEGYQLEGRMSRLRALLVHPLAVAAFYRRLASVFGVRFVLIVFGIYGLSQGIGESLAFYATKYLFTDDPPHGFGKTAASYQAYDGLAMFPWSCKALYGLISDTMPIGGRHRTPYIILAGILCVAAFTGLALTGPAGTPLLATLLMLLANLSIASPDVMLDATVANHCRTHPKLASDLQVLCWSSLGLCQMVGSLVKGSLLRAASVRSLYAVCAMTGAAVVVPASFGWLGEEHSARAPRRRLGALRDALCPAQAGDPATPLFRLALVITACALTQGAIGVGAASASKWVVPSCGVVICVIVVGSCWHFEKRVSPTLARASMYIFLDAAVQPHTLVIYKWCKATPSNCDTSLHDPPLPCFSPEFIGFMDVFASAAFVLGTAVYNRYLATWPYRSILRAVQLVLCLVNLLDLVWVSRWNLELGIPDKWFAMGYEVLQPLAKRSNLIPIFILAAKLCPPRAQATAFALNMGLANFGFAAGGYTGTALLSVLGGVEPPHFRNLRLLVIVRSLARLLPLLFIPLLVPRGSPQDDAFKLGGGDDAGLAAAEADAQRLSSGGIIGDSGGGSGGDSGGSGGSGGGGGGGGATAAPGDVQLVASRAVVSGQLVKGGDMLSDAPADDGAHPRGANDSVTSSSRAI